ncbi:hypothetical protein J3458_013426 [Metarhizium acridum]|uniref:uncharacterized protein n=1 Tax=Metarhizium acridum TaxID=92637 RepID=UPI001C6CC935|nr:hypothetical protein J3458_013426 [Metarhizium acridum]
MERMDEYFDRILWVPLRNLKLKERRQLPAYNFEHLLSHEYFSLPYPKPEFAEALCHVLEATVDKTLFLLDGLDEVSQFLGGYDAMSRFLMVLLNRPNVIITSRPNASLPSCIQPLDHELETIGFYPDQVREYIEESFTDPETAKTDRDKVNKVQSFLHAHWLIHGLVRIPIQLDALCYTWDDLEPGNVPDTMTGIYKAIVQRLWAKDAGRLEKQVGSYKIARTAEIQRSVNDEIRLLECLAFNGLHSDIIDFTPTHRDEISARFEFNMPLDEILGRLSVIRTSDSSLRAENQDYHFIHLTFQEYFAASYFVRHWKDRRQLEYLALCNKETDTKPSHPVEFLRKHKYTARYDVFWRFVAGLLDAGSQVIGFVNIIEEEPLDLLGPTHQRLVMHCLSEISGHLPMREVLEQRLSQWLLFECNFNHRPHLASEAEFPELALNTALREGSADDQKTILRSLAKRPSIPRSNIKLIASWLDNENRDMRQAAVEALGGQSALPNDILMAVVVRLADEIEDVRMAAIQVLGGQLTLSNEILVAVAAWLDHKDQDVRRAAVEALRGRLVVSNEIFATVLNNENKYVQQHVGKALGGRSPLPNEMLMAVATRLDENEEVRQAAIEALGGRSALPNEILAAVLDSDDECLRQAALEALGERSALPHEMLTLVVTRLADKNENVKMTAVEVLGRQSVLPNEILTAIAAWLDYNDGDVRYAAIKALARRSVLPNEMLTAVAAWLDDEDKYVRQAAVEALGVQSGLPNEILAAVATRLDDRDQHVRRTAVEALGRRLVLPNKILMVMLARLTDENEDVRDAAVEALGEQSALSNGILTAIAARLDNENVYVRQAAIEALGRQSALPDEILTAVAVRLDDKNEEVQYAAIETLGRQLALPDKMLTAIAARLNEKDRHVRRAAIEALGRRLALPKKILMVILARLTDENENVREAAVEALGERSALSNEILTAVAARLTDENEDVRMAALEALSRQSALSNKILTVIAARLADENKWVRQAAVEALGGQPALPNKMLTAVAARLDDQDVYVRRAATQALLDGVQKHGKLYCSFLNSPCVASLYKNLLSRSFNEPLSWYSEDNNCCFNMPEGIRRVSMDNQHTDIMAKINAARPADFPSTGRGSRACPPASPV